MTTESCNYCWNVREPDENADVVSKIFPKDGEPLFKWDIAFTNYSYSQHVILRSVAAPKGKISVQCSGRFLCFDIMGLDEFHNFTDQFEFDNDSDFDPEGLFHFIIVNDYKQYMRRTSTGKIVISLRILASLVDDSECLPECDAPSLPQCAIQNSENQCSTESKENKFTKYVLNFLKTDSEFHDVKIHVGNVEFKAHRNILAAVSPVFRAILTNNMMEKNSGCIHIKDLEVETVRLMIDFIYKGDIELPNFHIASNLLKASDIYDIQDLRTICVEYIEDQINENNVIDIILEAELINEINLKERAMEYMLNNPKNYKSEDFEEILKLRPSLLPLLLEKIFKKHVDYIATSKS